MRVIRAIIFLLVLIGFIWLVVLLFGKAFGGGDETPQRRVDVSSYANTSAAVEMYIDGPVVVNQEHSALRITVDRSQSKIERLSGYEGQVVAQQVFPNSDASYGAFLSALEKLNFARGNDDPDLVDDRGYCPAGNRYIYTMSDSSRELLHYWTTSCGGGTFQGNHRAIRQLFVRQVPQETLSDMTRDMSY